jgi:hypothetical protein
MEDVSSMGGLVLGGDLAKIIKDEKNAGKSPGRVVVGRSLWINYTYFD